MLPSKTHNLIISRRKQGFPVSRIARDLGVSESTVRRISRQLSSHTPPPAPKAKKSISGLRYWEVMEIFVNGNNPVHKTRNIQNHDNS